MQWQHMKKGPGSYNVLVGTAAVPGRKGMHIIRRAIKDLQEYPITTGNKKPPHLFMRRSLLFMDWNGTGLYFLLLCKTKSRVMVKPQRYCPFFQEVVVRGMNRFSKILVVLVKLTWKICPGVTSSKPTPSTS